MSLFSNQIALVTGGGSGIGRAICQVLARDGARVVAADVNVNSAEETVNQLTSKYSGDHLAIEVNVAESFSVDLGMYRIKEHYSSHPSLLANSAGITRDSFMVKMDEEMFTDVLNVNLKGTFLTTQAVSKALIEADQGEGGSIVNISSIVAKNGNMGQCNYAASKAGVEAFTKSSAKELARDGIRVNCVIPGFINTPIVDTVPEHLKGMILFATALKRMGEPEELAEAVCFLLSNKSSFMTGACMEVTGGFSM